jgi:uncharacterized membrane protein YgaE (UPF0421/DUF939 family)
VAAGGADREARAWRRVRAWWPTLAGATHWSPPSSTEVGVVIRSALGAGLGWWIADAVTGVSEPVLAAFTAIVVVQVSVRASFVAALQRSVAVVLGVLLALALGDALGLNALTVGALVLVTLGFAELVLRWPPAAARQVPVSALVVLAALGAAPEIAGWRRGLDTVIGAVVGVVVSVVWPPSRLVDAGQALDRLGSELRDVLTVTAAGLREPWSAAETLAWRRQARAVRARVVGQAVEAVGNSREAARWNVRDRRHVDVLRRYEETLPRLERSAIGTSVITRGLDDQARLAGAPQPPMQGMADLLAALAGALEALVAELRGAPIGPGLRQALEDVRARRAVCAAAAARRARAALAAEDPAAGEVVVDWLVYAALLVQVDRIVDDIAAPLPS